MKKSTSLEQARVTQPVASGIRKIKVRTTTPAKVKASSARRPEAIKPVRLLEEHFPNSEVRSTAFEYFNPAANDVFLAGAFNDWLPRATPMTKQRGGKWSTELLLKPGQYEYRLIVDGKWQDDPMAARFVANAFGGLNCVIEVKAQGI